MFRLFFNFSIVHKMGYQNWGKMGVLSGTNCFFMVFIETNCYSIKLYTMNELDTTKSKTHSASTIGMVLFLDDGLVQTTD